jgi:hypothetical protein
MGSVASTNAGLADLLQNLTSAASPLASELSSPAMQSALEKAPAGDIVQLSNEALQLQEMSTLFGNPSQTASSVDPSTILAALYPSSATPSTASTTSSASTSSASPADELASYQNALQSEQVQTLFGTTPTTTSDSLLNLVG